MQIVPLVFLCCLSGLQVGLSLHRDNFGPRLERRMQEDSSKILRFDPSRSNSNAQQVREETDMDAKLRFESTGFAKFIKQLPKDEEQQQEGHQEITVEKHPLSQDSMKEVSTSNSPRSGDHEEPSIVTPKATEGLETEKISIHGADRQRSQMKATPTEQAEQDQLKGQKREKEEVELRAQMGREKGKNQSRLGRKYSEIQDFRQIYAKKVVAQGPQRRQNSPGSGQLSESPSHRQHLQHLQDLKHPQQQQEQGHGQQRLQSRPKRTISSLFRNWRQRLKEQRTPQRTGRFQPQPDRASRKPGREHGRGAVKKQQLSPEMGQTTAKTKQEYGLKGALKKARQRLRGTSRLWRGKLNKMGPESKTKSKEKEDFLTGSKFDELSLSSSSRASERQGGAEQIVLPKKPAVSSSGRHQGKGNNIRKPMNLPGPFSAQDQILLDPMAPLTGFTNFENTLSYLPTPQGSGEIKELPKNPVEIKGVPMRRMNERPTTGSST